jgi:hypothetical protein
MVAVLWLHGTAFCEELEVSAQVDKTELAEGEVLSYAVTISGSLKENPKVDLGEIRGFYLVSTAQSHQLQVKGKTVLRQTVLTYLLTPLKPGSYVLGPAQVTYRGKVYQTQPIQVTVTARVQAPRPVLKGGMVL